MVSYEVAKEQVEKAIKMTNEAGNGFERGEAEKEMQIAQLLTLASIAKSLDGLIKNGLVIERP